MPPSSRYEHTTSLLHNGSLDFDDFSNFIYFYMVIEKAKGII